MAREVLSEAAQAVRGVFSMKKQVVRTKKLVLDRSTLRTLTSERLQGVVGGYIVQVSGTCQPCTERNSGCNGPLTQTM
jgi:hypothetical protein